MVLVVGRVGNLAQLEIKIAIGSKITNSLKILIKTEATQ